MVHLRVLTCVALVLLLAGCCCRSPVSYRVVEVAPPPAAEPVAEPSAEPPSEEPAALPAKAARMPTLILARKRVKGLEWNKVNLDQALTYLRTISGLPFTISDKVREEKFDDILISAQLDDVSLAVLLDSVLTAPFGLTWEERDGAIWVITEEEISGPLRLRYFDVKDLLGYRTPKSGSMVPVVEAPDGNATNALAARIKDAVHPGYWERKDTSIEGRNGILIVRASRPVHNTVDRYLAELRARASTPALPKALLAKLKAQRVSVQFDGTTFPEAIKTLQIISGHNIVIDSRIAQDLDKKTLGTIVMKDAPLYDVLMALAGEAGDGLLWEANGNILVLTHPEFTRVR